MRSDAAERKDAVSVEKIDVIFFREGIVLDPSYLNVSFKPASSDNIFLMSFDLLVQITDLSVDFECFVEHFLQRWAWRGLTHTRL